MVVFNCLTSIGMGLEITQPLPGSRVQAGDKVLVQTQPGVGENLKSVLIMADRIDKSSIISQPPFNFEFIIDPTFTGVLTIFADGKLEDGTIIKKKVQINVALPKGVVLKSIEAEPNTVFLSKLPEGSDPKRVRVFEVKSLSVGGVYSDGVEREITSSSAGTTYTSSNESVVKVDVNGKVTAQGVGTATITVKSSNLKTVVQVIVKSKNR
jgi:hypothetical protein